MSKITFTERGFAEYLYWQTQDKKPVRQIVGRALTFMH